MSNANHASYFCSALPTSRFFVSIVLSLQLFDLFCFIIILWEYYKSTCFLLHAFPSPSQNITKVIIPPAFKNHHNEKESDSQRFFYCIKFDNGDQLTLPSLTNRLTGQLCAAEAGGMRGISQIFI